MYYIISLISTVISSHVLNEIIVQFLLYFSIVYSSFAKV